MSKKKLTWAIIQPLTGGAYFAGHYAFGQQPEWILSYPGLDKEVLSKDGKSIGMGNERHFLKYLQDKNMLAPYVQFNHGMFDFPENISITNNEEFGDPKFKPHTVTCGKEIDLICSVPVCSGLSAANTQAHGKEDDMKNNNLKFLLEYVLNVIRPKVYLFENAPGLYTPKGKVVRDYLNLIAEKNGYSVTYVKTDTNQHHNIQSRPRTFAIFWKWLNGNKMPPPDIGHEYATKTTITDYLAECKGLTQNEKKHELNDITKNLEYKFIKKKFGKNWRKEVKNWRFKSFIIVRGLADEFYEFHKDDKLKAHYDYCVHKKDIGKGFYDRSFFSLRNEKMPTVYHGNTWSAIHPTEDRCLTMREYSHLMGMPHDWEYLHNTCSFSSVIGQNVPVKTFEHWIRECKTVLEDWNKNRVKHPLGLLQNNVYFFDNVKPRLSHYETK